MAQPKPILYLVERLPPDAYEADSRASVGVRPPAARGRALLFCGALLLLSAGLFTLTRGSYQSPRALATATR